MFVIGKISLFGNMPRFHLTTTQAWRDSEKYVNGSVAYFIAPCHPQQDSRHSNHCFCTLCVFNMDLLFCDNKKKGGGEGRGWAYRVFFSLFFFSSVNNWTKVRESKDTRREKAAENTGDCQAACDKTFTRELSPCHKALLFWIPKGFEFPNKLLKVDKFLLCQTTADCSTGHTFEPPLPEVVWRRFKSLYLRIGNPLKCNAALS